jgi:hypothetical protein
MKKEEIKIVISASVAISAIFALSYILLVNATFDVPTIARALSSGLSVSTLFWVFYFAYGWRVPLLCKIFYRPNINGTWSGFLNSNWVTPQGEKIEPLTFHIVVRQSFLRIHFTTFTEGFVGISYSETFILNKDKGTKNLAYLFRKDTTQNSDESLQEGATELKLIQSNPMILQGKYFSNQNTNGSIKVVFISREHVDSFEQALELVKK